MVKEFSRAKKTKQKKNENFWEINFRITRMADEGCFFWEKQHPSDHQIIRIHQVKSKSNFGKDFLEKD